MKRRALLLAVVSCFVLALVVSAGGGIDLSWNMLASGGGRQANRPAGISLDSTIGQSVSGVAAFGVISLCTGFWCPDAPFKLSLGYLPLVLR